MSSSTIPDISGREPGFAQIPPREVETIRTCTASIFVQAKGEKDLVKLVRVIQELAAARKDLSFIEGEIHHLACNIMGTTKKIDLGGSIGMVERTTSSSTVWDDEAVFQELTKLVTGAVDPESGEKTLNGDEILKLLKDSAKISYWRKGKLRELKIDPDQVSETRWGGKRLRITSQEGRSGPSTVGTRTGDAKATDDRGEG